LVNNNKDYIPVPPRIELVVGEMAWKGAGIPSVTD